MARRRFDLKVELQILQLSFIFQSPRPSSNAAAPFRPSVLGKPRDTKAVFTAHETPSLREGCTKG